MLLDGVADIRVFVARPREQLHGQDIGVGIDDAPGQHRARLGDLLRAVTHARHERAQEHQIACKPHRDRQRQPGVGGRQQDQRTRATYQWFCQRIILETLAEIAWLATRFWPVCASGRAMSNTAAIPSRVRHDSSHNRAGSLAVTRLTTRPMNTGIMESSVATRKPTANSATNRPLAWWAKCQ